MIQPKKLFAYQTLVVRYISAQFIAMLIMEFCYPLNCSTRGNVDNIARIDNVANEKL